MGMTQRTQKTPYDKNRNRKPPLGSGLRRSSIVRNSGYLGIRTEDLSTREITKSGWKISYFSNKVFDVFCELKSFGVCPKTSILLYPVILVKASFTSIICRF